MKILFSKLSIALKRKLRDTSLVALDFDGVLTDNRVLHAENGGESVFRSRADSLAIDLLAESGLYKKNEYLSLEHPLDIVILSKESNRVIKSVSEKIKIKYQGSIDKKSEILKKEVQKRNISMQNVLFIGNDLNDFECIQTAGIAVAVADSCSQLIKVANYVTTRKGGDGAFREICELIMYAKKVHPWP